MMTNTTNAADNLRTRRPAMPRRGYPRLWKALVVANVVGLLVPFTRVYVISAEPAKEPTKASAKENNPVSPPADKKDALKPDQTSPAVPAEKAKPAENKPTDKKPADIKLPLADTQAEWLDSLAAGYTESSRTQKPILARAGSKTCIFCRRLAEEIKTQVVQDELRNFTLVEIDVDKSPADAALLRVSGIPALRILTSHGKPVAGHDGMLPAAELVTWLKAQRETAASIPSEDLANTKKPDKTAVERIVKAFQQQDAAVREAAIRRLLPYPDVAALAVVDAYAQGGLSSKLCAIELLSEWKAPVDGLDPWQAETLTEPRTKALNTWAASAAPPQPPAKKNTELAAADIATARETIAKMKNATPAEAQAMRERLARLGPALLPEVRAQLQQAETDQERERLTALRYRLAAQDKLVFEWPGGLERLSATDVATRQKAADDLAARATSADEALLLELFSDPVPLVREISLRTLTKVGGAGANSALLKLLDDPEPNVRAAVLNRAGRDVRAKHRSENLRVCCPREGCRPGRPRRKAVAQG